MNIRTECDKCELEFNINELENCLCINCRSTEVKNNNLTCDICYNERPKDMMVKCCNTSNIRVCECNVSICRRCADSMMLKCPTCRTKCDKFVYADEALDKPINNPIIRRPRRILNLSMFTVGQDILVYNVGSVYDIYIRKARIVSINASSLSVKLYSYSKSREFDTFYVYTTYTWTNELEPKRICVKNLSRVKTTEDEEYTHYVDSLVVDRYLMT